MRELTQTEVARLADRPKVRRMAVENFLLSLANCQSYANAIYNLHYDAQLYRWNSQTIWAILKGIKLSTGDGNGKS